MDEKLNPKDKVLLMREEGEGSKLKVVQGTYKNGKIKAIDPLKAKQSDFLIIDRHADPIENFFRNFINQAKNPSHTGFFAVSVELLDKVIKMSDAELEKHRINPKDFLKAEKKEQKVSSNENQQEKTSTKMKTKDKTSAEPTTEFKQFDTNRIPESEYHKYGIKPEDIEGELKAMSYGYKSPRLVDIVPELEGVDYPMKARLSLEEQPDGSLKFIPHPYQKEVDLDKPFQGVVLPADVKESLLTTGNGGRVVDLEPNKPGEKVPSLLSVDKLTNRLEAVPLDKLTVSQNLKGTELSPEQQQALNEGKKVLVEGMISKRTIGTDNPRMFDAYVQFNAAKGGYDFTYDGLNRNKYRQDNKQGQEQNKVRIPQRLLGVNLTEDQQNKLRSNKTVYIQGMMKDGQDQPFNAYVKVNNDKNKLDFFKWNPDRAKKQGAEVKPSNESKTQVAVNSHGKTNEATKRSQEPLKQGQQKPSENQQQTKKAVKKSKGIKM